MDIEDLTKTQLLLLTILVNFVTSIATGVLTVSLLDQAPTTVTQTVNRIVDHTIETVTTQVPVIGNENPSAGPSSEDLLVSAIAKADARTVTVYRDDSHRSQIGTGLYLQSLRTVVIVSAENTARASVVFSDGSTAEVFRSGQDGNLTAYAFANGAVPPTVGDTRLVPGSEIRQGQTAIALTSEGSATTGIVSKIEGTTIYTDLSGIPAGAAAVNLSGDVIGISGGGGTLLSADRISALVSPAQ